VRAVQYGVALRDRTEAPIRWSKDSEIERLKKAIEDANLAGFKEGFNSAENQLAELKAENERWRIICEEQAARIARSAEKFKHLKTIIESDD
jgi:CRISPR/Cas system CMR-associated protein Cmr5 small subunit